MPWLLRLDPKCLKEEIDKTLDSQTNEKLLKLLISIINLIKQNLTKQIDLNYLISLAYVLQKRPQIYLKETQLTDVSIWF